MYDVGVPVTFSDDDFKVVLDMLRRVHLPYGMEEHGSIVLEERTAWVVCERIAAENGWPPPSDLLQERLKFVTGPKFPNEPYVGPSDPPPEAPDSQTDGQESGHDDQAGSRGRRKAVRLARLPLSAPSHPE